jgi:hypothetical protein
MILYDVICYDKIRYDMIGYDTIRYIYDMIRYVIYDMIYDMLALYHLGPHYQRHVVLCCEVRTNYMKKGLLEKPKAR